MRVVPHGAREHDFHFLPTREPADFVVVGDVRVEADVFEVLGDDFGGQLAEAEPLARGLVVVEFLDQLGEAEVEERFAGDLRVVFREVVEPFSGRGFSGVRWRSGGLGGEEGTENGGGGTYTSYWKDFFHF